jgi:5-methylcytosine-specific restriction endonuclease McrA
VQQSLENCPALVLNADFRPLSYFPLSVWPWYEAVKASLSGRVNTVATYERTVRSPSLELHLPSVISLREYVRPARRPAFTRFNVFLRDSFSCQYCNNRFPVAELTFDHVVPRSRGGRTSWENVVAACGEHNLFKSNRTPQEAGLRLVQEPHMPTSWELQENGRAFPPNYLHESWSDFLYWDSELETG